MNDEEDEIFPTKNVSRQNREAATRERKYGQTMWKFMVNYAKFCRQIWISNQVEARKSTTMAQYFCKRSRTGIVLFYKCVIKIFVMKLIPYVILIDFIFLKDKINSLYHSC